VGRKLTLALGGHFTEPTAPVLEEAFAPSTPSQAVHTSPTAPEQTLVSDRSRSSKPPQAILAASAASTRKRGGVLWLSSLGLGGGVVLVGLVWALHEPLRGPATPVVNTDSPPAPPLTAVIAEPAPAEPNVPDRVAASEPPPPAVKVSEGDECRWDSRAPDLSPEAGNRPDNYVHMVAQQAVTVCWRDAEKKTRKQTLQAQEAVSFWGTPPFQIYATQPAALKVYFKGQVVRWSESDATHIALGRRASSLD